MSEATVHDAAAAVDLIAVALAGGLPPADALAAVALVSPAQVADDLRLVEAAMRWGVEPSLAWNEVGPVWAPAAVALTLAGELGLPPRDLLHGAAAALRRAEATRAEHAVNRLSVLLVLPLGLLFLPAFALLAVVPVVISLARSTLSGMG
ncbi:type II secretion system F family protein [Yimella sp. cx-573]|nr:type II secretion system F family protein [Yimella sp. cx-573]